MIDHAQFMDVWGHLCQRFGRDLNAGEAKLYRAYLEGQNFTTEQFLIAARVLWATREFFPRPADFLFHMASSDWEGVLEFKAIQEQRQLVEGEFREVRSQVISDRGWRAFLSIGGMEALKNTRDLLRFRQAFFDAYDRQVAADTTRSMSQEIGNGPTHPRISEGFKRLTVSVE